MIKIKKTDSQALSDKVLRAVERSPAIAISDTVSVTRWPYKNGREHGYTIVIDRPYKERVYVSFAQNRNSDDVVVYHGTDLKNDLPSDRAYFSRTLFRELDKSVKFIRKLIWQAATGRYDYEAFGGRTVAPRKETGHILYQ